MPKIRFSYEIAFETDTEFKASLYQSFMESAMTVIQNYYKGKPNKVVYRLLGKDYKQNEARRNT